MGNFKDPALEKSKSVRSSLFVLLHKSWIYNCFIVTEKKFNKSIHLAQNLFMVDVPHTSV